MEKNIWNWRTAQLRGGLKESQLTERPITEKAAKTLIEAGLYKQYAYDTRINAMRYLLQDLPNNLGLPAWINHYTDIITDDDPESH